MSSNLSPRLSSSTKWTDLPTDFVQKIQTIFQNQFKAQAKAGEFLIEGRIYPEELVMRAGYLESGRLKQINFEASMDLPKKQSEVSIEAFDEATEELRGQSTEDSTMDRIYACVDALGSLLEEYFQLLEGDEIDVPLTWRPYEFEGSTVYLQHSTVNTRLEEEADRILGLLDSALVQERETSDDALANAEIDSELAFEIQKMIRAGKYPRAVDAEEGENGPTEPNLN